MQYRSNGPYKNIFIPWLWTGGRNNIMVAVDHPDTLGTYSKIKQQGHQKVSQALLEMMAENQARKMALDSHQGSQLEEQGHQ